MNEETERLWKLWKLLQQNETLNNIERCLEEKEGELQDQFALIDDAGKRASDIISQI